MGEKNYPPGYGIIAPVSDYRPWDVDDAFRAAYDSIRDHTMVDEMRLYDLWILVEEAQKVAGDILEVGVWRGGSGALLAHRAVERTVYLADTFRGVVKAGPKDDYYRGGEHANTSIDYVRKALEALAATNARIVEGIFPDESADRVSSDTFCLCHIDVDVYQSAKDVFEWVWPRLSVGGIVVFDDYGFYGCEGVTRYVDEIRSMPDAFFSHNLTGHAVLAKTRLRV